MPFTLNVLSNTTGCSDECVDDMQRIPGAYVDPDLNRLVRDQFSPHIKEYIDFHLAAKKLDRSSLVDLGTFMEG